MPQKTARCHIGPPPVATFLHAMTVFVCLVIAAAAGAQPAPLKLAVEASLTGSGDFYGVPSLDAARLAVEEANNERDSTPVQLDVADDQSSPERATEIAQKFADSDALAVIGPNLTVVAMATGPVFAKAGLVSIAPTAHGDAVPTRATTFQPIFNTSSLGSALANYHERYFRIGTDPARARGHAGPGRNRRRRTARNRARPLRPPSAGRLHG
ncbi:MAG: ABC transporter substrate-binding protein, partial [Rhodopila sp.]